MLNNWTIKKRITAGFAVIVALSTIMGILAWNSMRTIAERADGMANDDVPGLAGSGDIAQNVAASHLALIRHVLSTNLDEKHACEARINELVGTNTTMLGDLEKICSSPEEKACLEKLTKARQDYTAARATILQLSDAGKNAEATALLLTSGSAAYDAYDKVCAEFNDLETKLATDSADSIQHNARASKTMLVATVLGEVAISVFLAFLVVTGLNRVLRRVSSSLADGSSQVVSAAGQVSSSSQSLAEGASEQASSLEETSSSLEEMSSMTKRNAENAQKANDLAKQARQAADKGAADMQTMSAAMEAIKTSSDDIAKIIKTIDEIAFQTNILALNAAVEAARAGEAGMGFAVVADEVRNLAQRSAQAAKETAAKIEGAIGKTAQGVGISKQVAETLNAIVTQIRQVDELAAEVAGASREQTQGITQINVAVGQMDKVTQSNAASAEESAAAAEELNAQAEAMRESVGKLLELVGGTGQETTAKDVRASQAKHFPASTPVSKRPAAASRNGKGNGDSHTVPMMTTATHRRSEIPMAGEFKDF